MRHGYHDIAYLAEHSTPRGRPRTPRRITKTTREIVSEVRDLLSRGEAHLAGSHLLDEESGAYNVSYIEQHLAGKSVVLVHLAGRVHGDRAVRFDLRVVPAAVRGVADGDHMVGEVPPEARLGQDARSLVGRRRPFAQRDLEVQGRAHRGFLSRIADAAPLPHQRL